MGGGGGEPRSTTPAASAAPWRPRTPSSRKNPGRFAGEIPQVFQADRFSVYAASLQWHESRKGSRNRPFFLAAFKVLRRGGSHPSRVCGLKPGPGRSGQRRQSHPSRVCGLKRSGAEAAAAKRSVTPFAGVWIETDRGRCPSVNRWASHPSRVCGLKLAIDLATDEAPASHPSRVCGLKRPHARTGADSPRVTPFAGVWIKAPDRRSTALAGDRHTGAPPVLTFCL